MRQNGSSQSLNRELRGKRREIDPFSGKPSVQAPKSGCRGELRVVLSLLPPFLRTFVCRALGARSESASRRLALWVTITCALDARGCFGCHTCF